MKNQLDDLAKWIGKRVSILTNRPTEISQSKEQRDKWFKKLIKPQAHVR